MLRATTERLRKAIIASLPTIESMVQALATLHNHLIDANSDKYCPRTLTDREDDGNFYDGEWRQDVYTNLLPVDRVVPILSNKMLKK
ncbi:hypothetical protein QE152_g38463 [Popillia japonica]|uniref:Uncharacterized protein n=1 Tax=Popillia japonica TaxID=7064 RepID=A0AAW1HXW9_POPJA